VIKTVLKWGLYGLAGIALVGCSDVGGKQDQQNSTMKEIKAEIKDKNLSEDYVGMIKNQSLTNYLSTIPEDFWFEMSTEILHEKSRQTSRNPLPMDMFSILKAVNSVGPITFERRHNKFPKTIFMFDKYIIDGMPDFESIWLHDPKSLSPTGPKPATHILPYYYQLDESNHSKVFVGQYYSQENISLDMGTLSENGDLIRVVATGDKNSVAALSKIDASCDAICQILTAAIQDVEVNGGR